MDQDEDFAKLIRKAQAETSRRRKAEIPQLQEGSGRRRMEEDEELARRRTKEREKTLAPRFSEQIPPGLVGKIVKTFQLPEPIRLKDLKNSASSQTNSTSFSSSLAELSRRLEEMSPGVTVPSDIQARGPKAFEAYNNALLDGKAFIKRVPIMIIGQDRTGKTSLKKSLKGEKFNKKEDSTVGIETDPAYFEVSTTAWRTGAKDTAADPESKVLFEHQIAQRIFLALKNVKAPPMRVKATPKQPLDEPNTSSSESLLTDSTITAKSKSHRFQERVPESIATLVNEMFENDNKINEEDGIFSIIWDFGGQSVYYDTHPIFLTEKAIYILACDLSRDPYERADTLVRKGLYSNREDICCNKTNLDYVDFWLSSVYSLASPNTLDQDTSVSLPSLSALPPIFFVCTHSDEPYCTTSDPRRLALQIYGFLRTKPYKNHLFKDVFVVDNTKSGSENECPDVVRLREEILSTAQGLPHLKEAVPLKWLRFEHSLRLLRQKHVKLIAIREARQIAADSCGIDDDEQFRTMLDFLHDQKVLIHFNETPELSNMVILDPQWLIDIFKLVITIKRYEPTEDIVEQLWLQLQETGILDERLLNHVWKSLINEYSKETCQSLIAIMKRFSLLCSWPSDGKNNQYLVPSMLLSPPTDKVVGLLASARIPSLFVRFESGRVPPGLFTRLVLQFYQWCDEEWKSPIRPQMFSNLAQFHILPDQGTSVIILRHSSSIEIVLLNGSDCRLVTEVDFTADTPDMTTGRAIHWKLRLILECMRREFTWLKNMKYEMCVSCPVCSQKCSPKCVAHGVHGCECLHLMSESDLQKCQYCTRPGFRGDCRIWIKNFEPWFAFTGVRQESRTPLQQEQDAFGCEVKDRSCVTYQKEKSLALPGDVFQCIESSEPKEIVDRFQECLQLNPADIKNPEGEAKRLIRCLANTAKSQKRIDVFEYLRTITPAGTTGPLLNENLDVRCIPLKLRKELTFNLCGGEEWKVLAESFGMSYNEIRFLDKRTTNPCDVVLDLIANHRHLMVGELYDRLVNSGLPGSADLL